MHVVPRRRARLAFSVLGVVALLAVCATTATALAAVSSSNTHLTKKKPKRVAIAGKWLGSYSGAYSGSFTLKWTLTKSILHGTIALSAPHGTYGITGSVNGSSIKFGAVAVGATYTGKRTGSTMGGTYKTPGGNGTWSAHKAS